MIRWTDRETKEWDRTAEHEALMRALDTVTKLHAVVVRRPRRWWEV